MKDQVLRTSKNSHTYVNSFKTCYLVFVYIIDIMFYNPFKSFDTDRRRLKTDQSIQSYYLFIIKGLLLIKKKNMFNNAGKEKRMWKRGRPSRTSAGTDTEQDRDMTIVSGCFNSTCNCNLTTTTTSSS